MYSVLLINLFSASIGSELLPLSKEIVELLKAQPGSFLPLAELSSTYEHHFGRPLKVETYGFSKLTQLMDALSAIIEVSKDWLDLK